MGELGERLRQAREAKGISLEQAEEGTKIRRRFLEALEAEDYGQLPGEAYVRGFLRNYAYFLGLNPDEALLASGRQPAAPIPQKNDLGPYLNEPLDGNLRARWVPMAATALLVALVLIGGGWALVRYVVPQLQGSVAAQPPAQTVPSMPSATAPLVVEIETPTLSPTLTATNTPLPEASVSAQLTATAEVLEPTQTPSVASVTTSGLQLRLEATHRSWVSLTIDGKPAWAGTLEVGASKEWQAAQTISLHSGNAGGLRVWINGEEQPAIGALGAQGDYTWTASGSGSPVVGSTPSGPATPPPVSQPETPTYTPSPTATTPPPPGSTEAPTVTATAVPTMAGTPGPVGTPP